MSKKSTIVWVCDNCGNESAKWSGQCNSCREWDTLKQISIDNKSSQSKTVSASPIKLSDVKLDSRKRFTTKIPEMDLVLGGGIVPGSVILLGGTPGVGKSTLVWQAANNIDGNVVYIAGEESVDQIKLRSKRLGLNGDNVIFYENQDILSWLDQVRKHKPELLIVDSIQTVYRSDLANSQGSIVQVKESAHTLINYAKAHGVACIMIGHVTKEGEVAGPRTLEHLVDSVFYLEGEKGSQERFLRSNKNRFGPTDELGVFVMTSEGLKSYSEFGKVSKAKELPEGVARLAVSEGSRNYFVEVQALVQRSVFGYPKRNAVNYDLNRLQMIIAVLSKHTNVDLNSHDVYLNISEGYKLKDPIGDFAVIMALCSSYYNKKLSGEKIYLGEIDLSGTFHMGANSKNLIKSIKKLGYSPVYESKISLSEIIKKEFREK